jgi:hypothetical protein
LAVGAHLHLISEAHVMFEVPAGHADIVGDLVDLVALFSPGQDAGAAHAVGGLLRGLRRIEVRGVAESLDGFQPAGVGEGHRRFGGMSAFSGIAVPDELHPRVHAIEDPEVVAIVGRQASES